MSKKNDEFKNLDQRQKDCLALIESLGIYELRALARIFGDNSPTTLKRDDHIRIIMEKIVSGEELRPLPMRQGRPYKELSNIDGILNELSFVSGKDYTAKSSPIGNAVHSSKVVAFHQPKDDVLKQKLLPVDVRGVLKEKSLKEFYLKNLENGSLVLVQKNLDNRLHENDYITGSAILMNDEGDYALDTVKTINFRSNKFYVDTFFKKEKTSPNEKFDFAGQKICLGGRYVVQCSKFLDKKQPLTKILQKLNEENVVTLALLPNVLEENEKDLLSLGFNAPFFLKYDEHPSSAYETISAFLDCVTRLQNQGLRLAIFVEDIVTVSNLIDFAFKNNAKALMSHTETSVETIKKLMLLPNADKSGACTTVFTTQDEADMFDQMYVSSVFKISQKLSI